MVLGAGAEQFNDPTATLLLQVDCIERDSQELRCVGYAVIPLFMDPREDAQPRRKNLLDYVLNQVGCAWAVVHVYIANHTFAAMHMLLCMCTTPTTACELRMWSCAHA